MKRAVPSRKALLAVLLLAGACASPKTIYPWGSYEQSVYNVCHGVTAADLTQDVQLLSNEVDRTRVEGRKVAPGVHAHLGYLYFMAGNSGAALAHFNAEKELYPESATFIDGLVRRMKS
ncbi:MAG TPA: DUF4810 domain-containing protein [Planctomycetota bacterium]|nr:DUF4810 domain-containing protein [Planctomycetota bacterium]